MISFEEVFAEPKAKTQDVAVQKIAEPARVETLKTPFDWSKAYMVLILSVILGVLLFDHVPSSFSDGDNRDDQSIIDDDRKDKGNDRKEVVDDIKDGAGLVLIAERGDGIDPDLVDFAETLKAFCSANKYQYRFYDSDQSSSKVHIDYAASRNVTPPFVSVVVDGKPTAAKSIDELKKIIIAKERK